MCPGHVPTTPPLPSPPRRPLCNGPKGPCAQATLTEQDPGKGHPLGSRVHGPLWSNTELLTPCGTLVEPRQQRCATCVCRISQRIPNRPRLQGPMIDPKSTPYSSLSSPSVLARSGHVRDAEAEWSACPHRLTCVGKPSTPTLHRPAASCPHPLSLRPSLSLIITQLLQEQLDSVLAFLERGTSKGQEQQ